MALLTDGKDVIDKNYKDLTTEMYAKGHSFFTYLSDNPDSLASCCRLRNQINENVFSFTNGLTGVQTGSCNVITINLNRLTQDACRGHEFDSSIHPYVRIKNLLIKILPTLMIMIMAMKEFINIILHIKQCYMNEKQMECLQQVKQGIFLCPNSILLLV